MDPRSSPKSCRKIAARWRPAILHTGYYVGFFLASVANYFIGATYGWRWMFFFGGVPALFIFFIRWGVKESRLWHEQFGGETQKKRPTMGQAFATLFSGPYKNRTTVMSLVYLVSIIGQWAGSIYVPTAITQIALREGVIAADAARIASRGSMVLAVGTMIGCLLAPILAERLGRKLTMGIYMTLLCITTATAFGYVFYLQENALQTFFIFVFLLGLAGANFAMYTLWLPELYPTGSRASAMGFISSIGRFIGGGDDLPGGGGRELFRQHRHADRAHLDRDLPRSVPPAVHRGDEGEAAAGLTPSCLVECVEH